MDFITIYSTEDDNEISILENIFREQGVKYQVHKAPTGNTSRPLQKSLLVAHADREKAKELLDQTGFLDVKQYHRNRRKGGKKFILIFLAFLILVVIGILITWFMNPG